MEKLFNLIKNNIRQYTMIIATVVACIIFGITTNGILLVPMNVTNLILQNAYVFILAIGMMVLLINGGNIDLSVGSVVAFLGCVLGIMIIQDHLPIWLAIVAVLIMGGLIGLWNGFWVAYIKVPGFIVTLTGMLLFRGLALYVSKGLTISPFSQDFVNISAGFIPDFIGGEGSPLNYTALAAGVLFAACYVFFQIRGRIKKRKLSAELMPWQMFMIQTVLITAFILFIFYWMAAYEGIPIIFIIIAVLVAGYQFFMTRMVPGRHVYAMGGNEKAAKLSGVSTSKILMLCYVSMGVMTGAAAVATASRLNAAPPNSGLNYEMDAISACFIGGASMYGGAGMIVGAIIGALFMGILNNGMSIMGAKTDVQQVVKGLVLLFAVVFDIFSKSRAKAASIG